MSSSTKSIKLPYALVDNVYSQVAENLWSKSQAYKTVVMHGTQGISISDFQKMLTEEDRQIMECGCCKAFFQQYSNLLAINSSGEVVSALFRDINTSNRHAKALFNQLADIVESGKPSHFVDNPLRGYGQRFAKIVLGVKETGGFKHYYGYIARQAIPKDASFETSVSGLYKLIYKYGSLDRLADATEALLPPFYQEKKVALHQRVCFEDFTLQVRKLHTIIKSHNLPIEHALACLWSDGDVPTNMLLEFNSGVLAGLIERFIESGDYRSAVEYFFELSHI